MNRKIIVYLLIAFQNLFSAFEIQTIRPVLMGRGGIVSLHPDGLNPAALGERSSIAMGFDYSNLFGLKDLQSWDADISWTNRSQKHAARADLRSFGNEIYQEKVYGVQYGYRFRTFMNVGAGLNYYHVTATGYGGTGSIGLTCGAKFYPNDSFRIALLFINVNNPKLSGSKEMLPQVFAVGAQYFLESRLEVNAELFKDTLYPFSTRLGLRVRLFPGLNGFLGLQTNPERLSGGAELEIRRIKFEMAFQNHVALPLTFSFGCGFQF